ncbi:YadA-like family protein [Escherichia coli]|uniref:YadA-like family protein n=1 Tax=Escherichia coli TaxID=562 RepID=UPI000BE7D4AE|nr:YadA-like family protein [Escherichia coli]EFH8371612.1 adhesin [Escherichia coli]EFN7593953.1 adhesin [Escherichia coli]EFN7781295.1 adhesin [Escherichia coli]EHS5526452.1 YadA-like family protein [Escherichia coli]EJF7630405.1 YadA-like family protein [Escherichia coli]
MNKIFKVIWNPATGSYTVASETAKSRGKKSGRSKLLISALVAGGLLSSFGAYAEVSLDGGTSAETPALDNVWIAIGKGSKASSVSAGGTASVAIGVQAEANVGSTALGFKSLATGEKSVSIGQLAIASGSRGVAIGSAANASASNTIAMGLLAKAGGDGSKQGAMAMGAYSEANGSYSIAFGDHAKSQGDYGISLGETAGANGLYSLALGKESNAIGDDSLALGRLSLASAANAIAMGADSSSSNDNAIAIGNKTQALGVNSMALGNASQASGESSIALGSTSEASEQNAIALGQGSIASKVNSIALGSNSLSSGENAIALGEGSAAGGSNSLAFGSQSRANGNDSVAIGVGAAAATDNSVAIGAGSTTDASNTVSVGNSTTKRKIANMAAGAISSTSTDAINGSQLYTISDSVAKRLGGGATVGNDGSISAVSYALKSGIYNNVGDALSGIDNNTLQWNKTAGAFSANHGANATNKITNVAKGTVSATSTDVVNGSQLYDLQQDALLWNGTAFSAAHGTEATSKITNVEDGTISDTSKDAVNGSQLKETKDDVATNTANIADNTADIATNTANIADNTADISTNTTDIATNTANIADNTADIATNTTDIATNTANIADNTADIATNTTDIATNTANIADNTADIATNTTDIATNTANIADNTADIATNTTDIATNTANIADNTADIATNTTDIATNTADIATNASSITTLNADVDTLEKDALLWNGTAFSAKHGVDGADSKITNVAAGSLADDSTDAVNGAQLKATNDSIAIMGDTISDIEDDALLWDGSSFSAKHGTKGDNSKITNLLAGTVSSDSTDAINGSQLYGVADSFTSYLGGGADISDTGVLSGPTYTIGGTDYTNVGDALAAINTSFSTSLGDALLWDATAGKFSAKHGINNAPSVITDVANGAVSSTSSDAINGSQLYGVSDYIADALGGNAVVNTDGSITTPTYAIAGGSYNNVGDALEAIDTTLDDALLWDTTANGGNGAFSAAHGKDKTASVITNVANGAVSATSRDAINGSQLYSTNKYIADVLGGDAEVNADGSITAPTYTIANTDYNNVGEALDALDNNALLWDEDAGAYNASHDGNASKITNVAAGDLSTTSTDAVNGSQLNATNILVTQNSQMINQLAGNTSKNYIEDNGAGINYVRTNDSGLAFNDASAAGIGSTAVGYNSVADGDNSVAIGHGSNSIVETSIALGSESVSSRVIVKGSRNTSVSEEGVVIGYDTTDGELLGALSIGDDGKYRQIINVADGSEAHDAVTVRQLQNAIGAVATTPTKYYHANSTAEDSLAVGEDSLAMGAKTIVNGNAGIGIGLNTLVLADAINGIAIGSNARANHADSIAMGNGSQTTRGAQTNYTAYNMDAPQNSVGEFSVGSEDGQRQITNVAAGSADTDAVNVGQLKVTDAQVSQNTQSITNLNTQVTNLDTRVTNIENGIGDIVTTGSTKYFKTNTDGADANAQGKDSVAIGSGSIAAADNSVALGTGSVADEENTISVGSSTNQRRITNVAAGVNATDAVNVSQLKSSEAGGVRYDTKADGSIDYSNITLGGGNGGTTRISNVSAGVNNNDAVNYAQLKQSVQETKQYTDQRMVEMDNKLSKTESKLSGGIASAMAMTGLPQAYTPGASMASIGGGTYNGESAVALGVSMVSANGRWVYKLQGSTNSQGEYSAALGAGIQW